MFSCFTRRYLLGRLQIVYRGQTIELADGRSQDLRSQLLGKRSVCQLCGCGNPAGLSCSIDRHQIRNTDVEIPCFSGSCFSIAVRLEKA
jgi:hypothetical protein